MQAKRRQGCAQASHRAAKLGMSWVPTRSTTRKAIRSGASARVPERPGVVGEPGMCRRSSYGNREISRLTSGLGCWPASERRGAVTDDARTREVRPRHSSDEADEQSRATGSGAGGAKGGGQGERGPAKHAPGAGPGKCVTGAGPRTASCKATEEGEVHCAVPPYRHPDAPDGVLRAQAGSGARRGRADMAGLRGRPRPQDRGSARTGPTGERIGRNRLVVGTYRSRMVVSARSRWLPSKTRSSRGQLSRC